MGDVIVSGLVQDDVYRDAKSGDYYKMLNVAEYLGDDSSRRKCQFVVFESVSHSRRLFVWELDRVKFKLATKELYSISG